MRFHPGRRQRLRVGAQLQAVRRQRALQLQLQRLGRRRCPWPAGFEFDLRVQRRVGLRAERPARLGALRAGVAELQALASSWPSVLQRGPAAVDLRLGVQRAGQARVGAAVLQQPPQRLQPLQRRHVGLQVPAVGRAVVQAAQLRVGEQAVAVGVELQLGQRLAVRRRLQRQVAARAARRPGGWAPGSSCALPRSLGQLLQRACGAEAGSARSKSALALRRCGPLRQGESSRPGHQGSGSKSLQRGLAARRPAGARASRASAGRAAWRAHRRPAPAARAARCAARWRVASSRTLHRLRRAALEQLAVEVAAQLQIAVAPLRRCCRRSRCRRAATGRPAAWPARAHPAAPGAARSSACRAASVAGLQRPLPLMRPAAACARAQFGVEGLQLELARVVGPGLQLELELAQRQAPFVPAAGGAVVQCQRHGGRLVEPLGAGRGVADPARCAARRCAAPTGRARARWPAARPAARRRRGAAWRWRPASAPAAAAPAARASVACSRQARPAGRPAARWRSIRRRRPSCWLSSALACIDGQAAGRGRSARGRVSAQAVPGQLQLVQPVQRAVVGAQAAGAHAARAAACPGHRCAARRRAARATSSPIGSARLSGGVAGSAGLAGQAQRRCARRCSSSRPMRSHKLRVPAECRRGPLPAQLLQAQPRAFAGQRHLHALRPRSRRTARRARR